MIAKNACVVWRQPWRVRLNDGQDVSLTWAYLVFLGFLVLSLFLFSLLDGLACV